MANQYKKPDDVVKAADQLMLDLMEHAAKLGEGSQVGDLTDDELEKKLSIMQTATRWIAVKNRMNGGDGEESAFDGWRNQVADAPGAVSKHSDPVGAENPGSVGRGRGGRRGGPAQPVERLPETPSETSLLRRSLAPPKPAAPSRRPLNGTITTPGSADTSPT